MACSGIASSSIVINLPVAVRGCTKIRNGEIGNEEMETEMEMVVTRVNF